METVFRLFLITFIFLLPFNSFSLEPHIARYDIKQSNLSKESDINGINGKSIYKLEKECTGWKSSEDFAVIFELNNGANSKLLSNWSTFETFSGRAFEFQLKEVINDRAKDSFYGYANLLSSGGKAEYFSKSQTEITLPDRVVFPIQHLQRLIIAAKNKEKVYNSNVFLGSEVGQGHRLVSAIIGKRELNDLDLNINLVEKYYWPVNIAYFDPDSNSAEPEYKISAKLQKNGVITNFTIDYGDFSINASLRKLELISENLCN